MDAYSHMLSASECKTLGVIYADMLQVGRVLPARVVSVKGKQHAARKRGFEARGRDSLVFG